MPPNPEETVPVPEDITARQAKDLKPQSTLSEQIPQKTAAIQQIPPKAIRPILAARARAVKTRVQIPLLAKDTSQNRRRKPSQLENSAYVNMNPEDAYLTQANQDHSIYDNAEEKTELKSSAYRNPPPMLREDFERLYGEMLRNRNRPNIMYLGI